MPFHQMSQSRKGINDVGSKVRAYITPCTPAFVPSKSEGENGVRADFGRWTDGVVDSVVRRGNSEERGMNVGSKAVYGVLRFDGDLKCGRCRGRRWRVLISSHLN